MNYSEPPQRPVRKQPEPRSTRPLDRQQQITLAVEIIGDGARRSDIERTFRWGAGFLKRAQRRQRSGQRWVMLTKKHKSAAVRLAKALRKLKIALAHPDLTEDLKLDSRDERSLLSWIKGGAPDEIDLQAWFEERLLKRWFERAYTAAYKTKLPQPKNIQRVQREAVEQAAALCKKHGLPLTVTRTKRTAEGALRGSQFCRLAAVIFGDANADLSRQCDTYIKQMRRPSD